MLSSHDVPRRRVLQWAGMAALVPFLPAVAAARPAHAAPAGPRPRGVVEDTGGPVRAAHATLQRRSMA